MKATKENIELILESLYNMSLIEDSDDWDESVTQDFITRVGPIWEDYLKGKVLILDSDV